MGKTSMCIKMLELLNTGRVFKAIELANILETNVRNIIEYKKELEEAGYYITSIPGKYGGYKLETNSLFPTLKLTEGEKDALLESFGFIVNKKDFVKKNEYIKGMSKVFCNFQYSNKNNDVTILNRFPLTMPENEIKERYTAIEYCIKEKKVLEINYLSLKNVIKTHRVHPYKIYSYNNAWFFLAWHEKKGDVGYYKINRIDSYSITDDSFRVWKCFNEKDYIDETGMKKNGDYFHIEFIAKNQYASLVKERIYGKNQIVEAIDDYNTKVSVDMQNKENIIVFILGFGKNIEVIEPMWLKEELINISNYILNIYK